MTEPANPDSSVSHLDKMEIRIIDSDEGAAGIDDGTEPDHEPEGVWRRVSADSDAETSDCDRLAVKYHRGLGARAAELRSFGGDVHSRRDEPPGEEDTCRRRAAGAGNHETSDRRRRRWKTTLGIN